MRAQRIFWFVVAIGFGLAAGLLFGWMAVPPRAGETTPETLRSDYRTDLALMTAEIYQQEEDPAAAAARLAEFSSGEAPLRAVQQAILTGQELGYSPADIESLAQLYQALEAWSPPTEGSQP